jgi:hypothetical protein
MGSSKPPRYRCFACHRPRSSTYHNRHPPNEPPPRPSICRRCVDEERQIEERQAQPFAQPQITVYEIHHHYACCKHEQHHDGKSIEVPISHHYESRITELPLSRNSEGRPVEFPLSMGYPGRVELSADQQGKLFSLHQVLEQAPPQVMPRTKPGSQGYYYSGRRSD